MFSMFRFCNIFRSPMFQKYTAVETLDNISMTCVVEAWCYHFWWFLCNLFRPSDESFTSTHRTSHMFIIWCPSYVDFRISFYQHHCCVEKFQRWMSSWQELISQKNLHSDEKHLQQVLQQYSFLFGEPFFWLFHWVLNLPCSVYMMFLNFSLTNHHTHSNKSIQIKRPKKVHRVKKSSTYQSS